MPLRLRLLLPLLCLGSLPLSAAQPAAATAEAKPLEKITFLDKKGKNDKADKTRSVLGRVVVTAQDGGLLVQERDGRLWTVTPDKLKSREKTGRAFKPFSAKELGEHVKRELDGVLGEGFSVITTPHYTIVSSADPRYARWCGALFERLRNAFATYWKGRKVELTEPEFPLAAIVLKDRIEFGRFASHDAGLEATTAVGYYSILTNRIVLFDLAAIPGQPAARNPIEIQRRLAVAPQAIATVVHEAAHQIAFNSGLHRRLADNPMWLTEGMAVFFETPDLKSPRGWRTVGKVNVPRLSRFVDYINQRRRPGSLKSLVVGDDRFRDAEFEADAYAEAWALSYFLLRARRKQYTAYLATIANKPLLRWDTPTRRQADFEAAFGNDWAALEQQFLKYISRVKPR